MVERIILNDTTFQISRPGYDVTTCTEQEIAFDGFLGPYNGCLMSGESSEGSTGWSSYSTGNPFLSGAVVYRNYLNIPFGFSLSAPPQVIYTVRNTGGGLAGGAWPRFAAANNPSGAGYQTAVVCGAVTYIDHLMLYIDTPFEDIFTGTYGIAFDIAYVVFQT